MILARGGAILGTTIPSRRRLPEDRRILPDRTRRPTDLSHLFLFRNIYETLDDETQQDGTSTTLHVLVPPRRTTSPRMNKQSPQAGLACGWVAASWLVHSWCSFVGYSADDGDDLSGGLRPGFGQYGVVGVWGCDDYAAVADDLSQQLS